MRLAIMQPYIFPYLGYFQLIKAVDKFIIYDDVNFIKGGWINRNKILVNEKDCLFTVPLKDVSSFKKINETEINPNLYRGWKEKFFKTLNSAYNKAPYFSKAFPLIKSIFEKETNSISCLSTESIVRVSEYLNIKTTIVSTSSIYDNSVLTGSRRVIDICKKEEAKTYINAIGGKELYSKENFSREQIQLFFIKPNAEKYLQFKNEFVPWLSIIDIIMFNSTEEVNEMLSKYSLL